jgi:hypothetical protein
MRDFGAYSGTAEGTFRVRRFHLPIIHSINFSKIITIQDWSNRPKYCAIIMELVPFQANKNYKLGGL